MSATVRCTCPNCHGVYRVPTYALDTKHICPFCKMEIVLTACGGRTKLELAGVSGAAKTTLHAPKSESKTTEYVPVETAPGMERKWLLGAIAGSIVLAVCCAGCGLGGLWLLSRPDAIVNRQSPLPTVEVDPAITNIHFGPWRKIQANDLFGNAAEWLIADITARNKPANSFDFEADQLDTTDKKLDSSGINFPKLNPGERGEAHIRLERNAVKIIIRQRKRSALKEELPKKAPPRVDVPKKAPPRVDVPKEDADKEEFARFVRLNAQDPRELEILSWDEKEKRGGAVLREVRFRCKLIAITPAGTFSPGVRERGGDPILLDDAQIFYAPDGKIDRVHLNRSRCWWNAPAK